MAPKVDAAREWLYDDDFYAWTRQQAALLRARRFDALDLGHLVEATLELGDALQRDAVLGNACVVLEHLLTLAHSPATDPGNGWRATVRAPRENENPCIRRSRRQLSSGGRHRIFGTDRVSSNLSVPTPSTTGSIPPPSAASERGRHGPCHQADPER